MRFADSRLTGHQQGAKEMSGERGKVDRTILPFRGVSFTLPSRPVDIFCNDRTKLVEPKVRATRGGCTEVEK